MTDPEARKLLALAMMDAALEAHSSGDPARVQAAQQELHALAALAQLPNLGARMAQRLDEGGAPWEAGEESDWVEVGLTLDFAESDWRREPGPRSDRRWVHVRTGRVVYQNTNPGAPRTRGQRSQGTQSAAPAAATRPATPAPTAARRQSAGSVQDALGRITGGSQSTAADLHTLLEGLPTLTVAQLRQARQQLQASFGGATRKEGMVDALRGHVQGMLDRQAPQTPPAPREGPGKERAPRVLDAATLRNISNRQGLGQGDTDPRDLYNRDSAGYDRAFGGRLSQLAHHAARREPIDAPLYIETLRFYQQAHDAGGPDYHFAGSKANLERAGDVLRSAWEQMDSQEQRHVRESFQRLGQGAGALTEVIGVTRREPTKPAPEQSAAPSSLLADPGSWAEQMKARIPAGSSLLPSDIDEAVEAAQEGDHERAAYLGRRIEDALGPAPATVPTPPTPTTPAAQRRPGAHQPGDVWQGASGRWFTMRPDRQVVQTAAPGSEPGAGRGRSRAQQPEPVAQQASRTIDPQGIINAMHDEEPQLSSGAHVLLRDVRKRMGSGIPKRDFDRAIIDMAERGQIVLNRHDQPSFLTPGERQQLVQDEDGTYYVSAGFRAGQVLPRQDSVTPDDVGIDLSPTPDDVGLPTDPEELERSLQAGLDEDEPAVAAFNPPPVSSSEAAVSRVVDGVLQGRYTSRIDLEVALLDLKLPQQQQVATLLGVQPTEDMRQSANDADHAWALSQAVMDQMHGVEEPLTAEMVNEDEGIDLSGSGGTAPPVAPTIQALSPARPGGPQIAPITGRAEDAPHLPEGVSYVDAVPAAVRAVFGRDIDPRLLAAAGNATDEAYVTVTFGDGSSPEGAFFMMSSESGMVSASRTFHRHPNGEIEVHNDIQRIKPGHAGVGVNIFLNQVRALRAAGVTYITTTAVGDVRQSVTDGYNGYITWPKLGYDGEIPDNYWRKLPKPFRQKMGSKRNVQSLLAIPGGAEVWERYGGSIDLRFDLAEGSTSMQVLNKYVEKRRSQPPRPHRSEQAPQGRANQREAARKAELDAQIAQAMATWR